MVIRCAYQDSNVPKLVLVIEDCYKNVDDLEHSTIFHLMTLP